MPQKPLQGQYPEDAPATAGREAARIAWQDYFPEPELQRLIRHALACNRDLRIAAARVRAAAGNVLAQHAASRPELDLSLEGGRARVPAAASGVGRPVLGDQYQAHATVGWELDLWGRLAALDEAALSAWMSSAANRQALAAALVAQVADHYFGVRELDERIRLADAALASRNDTLRIFERRHAVGATSRLDLMQVQTLQTQAESLVYQLREARAREMHALTLLTGGALAAPTESADVIALAPLASGIPSELLLVRPDIVAAEMQLRSANASITAARAAYFPRVALTAAGGSASTALGDLFGGGNAAWRLGSNLLAPVYDGGHNRAALEQARASRDLALAAYERTVQNAFREVADALGARSALAGQVAVGERAVAAQRERARLAALRYAQGTVTFLEVLDAQRDLLQAEQQQVQNRRAVLSNQVTLYLALGGAKDAASSGQTCELFVGQ